MAAKVTLADIAALLVAQGERIAALEGAPVKARTDEPITFKSTKDGAEGFPCTAEPSCGRTNLRTLARAAIHGIPDGGHDPKAKKA